MQPRLLLLDEPLSALDAGLRERLADDLRDILRAAGTTALMVTHDHEEAFTVADRLAVMRAGRVVQQGDIAEVWRAPADAETALFLGYARVLEGEPAGVLLRAAGLPDVAAAAAVAVRRSALVAADVGPLSGTVVSARVTPEQIRLVVEVDGVGELDAVARLDTHPAAGDRVSLTVDASRLAVTPRSPRSRSLRPRHERRDLPTLAGVYRRAWTLLVVNAVVMGGLAIVVGRRLRPRLIDPEGSFLGPSSIRLPLLLLGALLLDMLPRTLWLSRMNPR